MMRCEAYNTKGDWCHNKAVAIATALGDDWGFNNEYLGSYKLETKVCSGHALNYARAGQAVKYIPVPKLPRWLTRNKNFQYLRKRCEVELWVQNRNHNNEPYDKGRYCASALVGTNRIEVTTSESLYYSLELLVKLIRSET